MNLIDTVSYKFLRRLSRPTPGAEVDQLFALGRLKYHFKLKTYSEDILRNVFGGDSRCKLMQPIFIVGAPRSGTTFLGDCMSRMDSVAYFFEPVYTKALGYMLASGKISSHKAEREFRKTYANLMRGDQGKRFCEKTPTNVFLMEVFSRWFPDAKFIHIIRDGVDMAASHVQKGWLTEARYDPPNYEVGGYRNGPIPQFWVEPARHEEFKETTDFNRSIWAWWTHVQAGRSAGERLGSKAYLEVRYEEMLRIPVIEGRRIIDFLGDIDSATGDSFIEALESGSLKSIGKGHRSVSNAEIGQMMSEARALMGVLGYL